MSETGGGRGDSGTIHRLLDAVVAISSDLQLPHVLHRLVEAACELVDARYGALGVIGPGEGDLTRGLVEFITVGMDEDTIHQIGAYPQGRGILGLLITDPKPRRIANLQEHAQSYGFPPNHPAMHSFLGVPVRVRDTVFGNLYLTEKRGGGEFTQADEDLVVALAGAAAVTIENARLHARVQELAVVEERERIARDLHDVVLQRLFATALGLQATAARVGDAQVAARVRASVEELDTIVGDIRGVIFALNAYEQGERSLRVLTLALAGEARAALGFEPSVHFQGPLDAALSPDALVHFHATLREALSNIARHAQATSVDIHLSADAELLLRVVDNGTGVHPAQGHRGNGLRNMAERAHQLGGVASIEPGAEHGTVVEWRVPLRSADAVARLTRP